jgi:hypothetical protein
MDILMITQYAYYELRKKYLAKKAKEMDIVTTPAPDTEVPSEGLLTTRMNSYLMLGLITAGMFAFTFYSMNENIDNNVMRIGRKLLQSVS